MDRLPMSEIIEMYRAKYAKLSPTFSKAIDEKVHFNMFGFKHLIFKGKRRRDNRTIMNRLVLVPLIIPVIRNCEEEVEIRTRRETINGKRVRVTYYALEALVGKSSARVRVVTRKMGEKGKHYFQSVMKY